jgi:catechol 2,3-dioxygenase-like lactoylglutathione lyase family enzyme
MSEYSVRAVRAVEFGVTDIPAAVRFFTEVWNLVPMSRGADVVALRGTCAFHHILKLRRAPQAGLIRIFLDAGDRATTGALYERVRSAGAIVDGPPSGLAWDGGGYGFGCRDPEGRSFIVLCDVADHSDSLDRPDRPRKISHVNLNCADNETTYAFMRDGFGFRLSDQTKQFRFLRCNNDHHSVVIGFNQDATLNHVAFEMPDSDSVMRGIGRMRDHGYPVEWGPGRHGPGNNVFAYFCGPEELPLEYTSEMQQVGEDHQPRMPEHWGWPPGRVDRWGITPGPTARMKRAQTLFRCSPDGFRLDR